MTRATLAAGYDISRVLKGGWQLAGGHGAIDPNAALADMDRFVESGMTTFDCADIYTGVEELIGRWRQTRVASAATIQVHTKYVPDVDRLLTLSRADVVRGIDRSLQRLGMDALDLVQLHWWDYDAPGYIDAARWLNELCTAGKIRHVGLTNFDRQRVAEIVDAGVPIVSHQVQYSVLDRRPAVMASDCASQSIGLLCYGALAGGFLSERWLDVPAPSGALENRSLVKYRLIIDEFGGPSTLREPQGRPERSRGTTGSGPSRASSRDGWDRFQRLLRVLQEIGARHRVGIGAVAMRWVLDQPAVAGIIVGARHAEHLPSIAAALTLDLTDADRDAIAAMHAEAAGPRGEVYELERTTGSVHASIMRYTLNRAP